VGERLRFYGVQLGRAIVFQVPDRFGSSAGLLQIIDVTASLASGQAVPIDKPFAPQRQFELAGDLTGVAASNTIDAIGAAHFDTFQPDMFQAGILAVDTSENQLRESSRTVLRGNNGSLIAVVPSGTASPNPFQALGSIDQKLALVTAVVNGTNIVTPDSPQGLATTGTVTLDDPNRLASLSESFRPDLQGSVLIDIQGNVQSLRTMRKDWSSTSPAT
jgi:hypothetical protein